MKIGILGAGHIGKSLARKLAGAGHDVTVANSRGPETIDAEALSTGACAVTMDEALRGVEVAILSIPLNKIPGVAVLVADLPEGIVVMDTSNYYPLRDNTIDAIESGEVESLWVSEQLGCPVVKAWNSIGSDSFARKGATSGTSGRIALPVAADSDADRKVGMALVEDTGFDAYDAGTLAQSWRQQPGAPCYCTDLTLEVFSSLKTELVDDELYDSHAHATRSIGEYIDGFYNPVRRHSYLSYASPIEFELKKRLAEFAA